jgi:hypothetical protein
MKVRRTLLVLAFVEAALIGSAKGAEPEVISWGMNLMGIPNTNTPAGISNVVALETAPQSNLPRFQFLLESQMSSPSEESARHPS